MIKLPSVSGCILRHAGLEVAEFIELLVCGYVEA